VRRLSVRVYCHAASGRRFRRARQVPEQREHDGVAAARLVAPEQQREQAEDREQQEGDEEQMDADLPPASQVVVNQLKTAAEGAQAANMVGNRVAELSRLSKAIGATEALLGMTSDCDECGDLKDVLQQIIGQAALLKTAAVGASGTCQPNGIIGPAEQCDPLAASTGCPVNTIELTYCSDECRCEVVPTP